MLKAYKKKALLCSIASLTFMSPSFAQERIQTGYVLCRNAPQIAKPIKATVTTDGANMLAGESKIIYEQGFQRFIHKKYGRNNVATCVFTKDENRVQDVGKYLDPGDYLVDFDLSMDPGKAPTSPGNVVR